MSTYHVYLPPSTLTALASDSVSIPRLTFQKLDPPQSTLSQNAWSHASASIRPHPLGLDVDVEHAPGPARMSSTGLEVDESRIKREIEEDEGASKSRAMGVKRSRGPLRKTQTEVTVSDTSRRRSTRLGRGNPDGLIGSLPGPGLDNTESFLSLNTTMSNPSQLFPPTADQSSLLNFPRWSIPLTKLTTLHSLLSHPTSRSKGKGKARRGDNDNEGDRDELVSLIVCILSVDQAVQRQRKEQKARGEQGTLWIGNWTITAPGPVAGEEAGGCQVKLWDNQAREYGDERVRKGDVVLLERVKFSRTSPSDPPQLVISDQTRPKITILYRTLPRYHAAHSDYIHAEKDQKGAKMVYEDRLLRPDLRLSRSDMGVRKVAEVARWFSMLIGGDVPM